MEHRLQNLLKLKNHEQVKELLALASGPCTLDRLNRILIKYTEDPSWELLGLIRGDLLDGLIGVELIGNKDIEIQHIAVRSEVQKKGIGTQLISSVQDFFTPIKVIAVTDSFANDFYKKLNFNLVDTFLNKFGTKRFKFEKVFRKTY